MKPAPRILVADGVMIWITPSNPDALEVRLLQLKAGVAGLTAAEVTGLKKAAAALSTDWLASPKQITESRARVEGAVQRSIRSVGRQPRAPSLRRPRLERFV